MAHQIVSDWWTSCQVTDPDLWVKKPLILGLGLDFMIYFICFPDNWHANECRATKNICYDDASFYLSLTIEPKCGPEFCSCSRYVII